MCLFDNTVKIHQVNPDPVSLAYTTNDQDMHRYETSKISYQTAITLIYPYNVMISFMAQ